MVRFALAYVGAFLAAVGSGVILSCAYALLVTFANESPTAIAGGLSLIATSSAYVFATIAAPTILVVALPYVIVSSRLKHFSRRYYLFSGGTIGLLVFALLEVWQHLPVGPPFSIDHDFLFFGVSAVVSGMLSAETFWRMARPDQRQRGLSGTRI